MWSQAFFLLFLLIMIICVKRSQGRRRCYGDKMDGSDEFLEKNSCLSRYQSQIKLLFSITNFPSLIRFFLSCYITYLYKNLEP